MVRESGLRRHIGTSAILTLVLASPAAAQVDPLLFLKTAAPNVLFVVDTSNRMQRDAPTDPTDLLTSRQTSNYYDPIRYDRGMLLAPWETSIGVTDATTLSEYRRRYVGLDYPNTGSTDKFTALTIETVGDLDPVGFSLFEAPTRLAVARAALHQAVTENRTVARFGLIKMRQKNPDNAEEGNSGPVAVSDLSQSTTETGSIVGRWNISRTMVDNTKNGAADSTGVFVVKPDTGTAAADILTVLRRNTRNDGALLPAGNDDANTVDTPVKLMLDDARTEAARLIALNNDPACRNTIVVLLVGGGEGTTSGFTNASLATAAANFKDVGGRRVPVYVIALAPPLSDVPGLRAIATTTGGQYFEITKAQIDAALQSPAQQATAGTIAPTGTVIVPEVVNAVTLAIQHAFVTNTEFNTVPALPTATDTFGGLSEFQVTSPIVGTVNLDGAYGLDGQLLNPDAANVLDKAGVKVPQRSNVMVTAGFSLPGFDGKLRAFRVYKPEADDGTPSGWRFKSDGTALWVACTPGTACAAAPDSARRNLFTATPDGQIVPFTVDQVATLAPLMNLDEADAAAVIAYVREQPIGAIVDSTPALMNPPSLDPPPDSTYPKFAADNEKRRAIVWVGTNNGIIEGIDARFGVEVWGFIPLNLLPKLKTLRDGQPVGKFDFFADSSPKIADVKYDDEWHTHMIIGEGPGGTFYQSFDVTMADQKAVLGGDDPDSAATLDAVLSYFSEPTRIRLNWSFPRYSMFDPRIAPYGDISASATAVEKSVGQTWSDPAVGQMIDASGPYAVMVGSGFFPYSTQERANRNKAVAGTTFYLLSAKDGTVYDSEEVPTDGRSETNDNCATDNGVNGCKYVKNALQTDPVATGPADSRFVTKAYVGDLDGNLWRFDMLLAGGVPSIDKKTNLYSAGSDQPIFNSMATVNVGTTQQFVFFGTGSDLLPATAGTVVYRLLGVKDVGNRGDETFRRLLAKANDLSVDERVTAFPAVAGDIVFFTTTTLKATCSLPDAKLYAFTFIGGPAYDNTNDDRITNADTPLVATIAGKRATAPFVVDQHLVFGTGRDVKVFGDPTDYNNGIGQAGVRILSWRQVR